MNIITKYLNINIDWLLTGRGKMLKDSEDITTETLRLEKLIYDLKERLKDKEDIIEAQKTTIESLKSQVQFLRK